MAAQRRRGDEGCRRGQSEKGRDDRVAGFARRRTCVRDGARRCSGTAITIRLGFTSASQEKRLDAICDHSVERRVAFSARMGRKCQPSLIFSGVIWLYSGEHLK